MQKTRRCTILGTGSYLPERVLTNFDLEKMVDTSDEWIVERSGIRERRLAADGQFTSDLGVMAVREALADAGVAPEEIDMLIATTVTPDMIFPSTACIVQSKVGLPNAACCDVGAACTGFLYSIEMGRHLIESGSYERVLVLGADKLSAITDWEDRSTCVLFGDGAGAVLLGLADGGRGIVDVYLGANGKLADLLLLPAGGTRNPSSHETVDKRMHYMKMAGREVFKYAVIEMVRSVETVLERTGITIDQIDCVIPHQANIRIIKALAKRVGVPIEKVFLNIETRGNMSAASMFVALDEASKSGFVKKGYRVLMVGFGAGLTWGAGIIDW